MSQPQVGDAADSGRDRSAEGEPSRTQSEVQARSHLVALLAQRLGLQISSDRATEIAALVCSNLQTIQSALDQVDCESDPAYFARVLKLSGNR